MFRMSASLEAIIRFRRRDVLFILPMTIVAALGACVWEPPTLVAAWLSANLILIGFSQALYIWLARPGLRTRVNEKLPDAAVAYMPQARHT